MTEKQVGRHIIVRMSEMPLPVRIIEDRPGKRQGEQAEFVIRPSGKKKLGASLQRPDAIPLNHVH